MILYFSATGNSRYVAQIVSEATGDKMESLNYRIKNNIAENLTSNEPYVIVCPIHAWRIPRMVEKQILENKFLGNRKAYFIVTSFESSGNAASYAKKLCQDVGFDFMGFATISMPGTYIAFKQNPTGKEIYVLKQAAIPRAKKLAEFILNGQNFPAEKASIRERFMSRVANPLYYKFIIGRKGLHTTEHCLGCGMCRIVCSLNNITKEGRFPEWGNNCSHCMACIHRCPVSAIEFRNITKGKNRTYNTGYLPPV